MTPSLEIAKITYLQIVPVPVTYYPITYDI